MALYSDLTYDSRVQREAATLGDAGHQVTIFCLEGGRPPGSPYEVIVPARPGSSDVQGQANPYYSTGKRSRLASLTRRARWMASYVRQVRAWGRWAVETAGPVDVWHAHDLPGLMAIVPHLDRGQRLVYDSHEIFVESGSAALMPRPVRWALRRYERRLSRRAQALVTVNEDLAEVLERRLRPKRMIILRNCPRRWQASAARSSLLREAAAIPESATVILYHGSLGTERGIEEMARSILEDGMEDVHAVSLGMGDREYLDVLAAEPRFEGRFHVLDAVPPHELLDWVSGADVDVLAIQNTTLNHFLSTPNKLWESIAAGVPVVVSDFPTMRRVVVGGPDGALGTVCDPVDAASIAAAIRSIVLRPEAEREALRARCAEAARTRWNWESESAPLLDLYAGS